MDVHPPKNGINRYWSIAICHNVSSLTTMTTMTTTMTPTMTQLPMAGRPWLVPMRSVTFATCRAGWFPKIGVPLVILHFPSEFPQKNQPAIRVSPFMETHKSLRTILRIQAILTIMTPWTSCSWCRVFARCHLPPLDANPQSEWSGAQNLRRSSCVTISHGKCEWKT